MDRLAPLMAAMRSAPFALLDLLLPPRCLGCGVTVAAPGQLCAGCWAGLTFLGDPCCRRCGLPFHGDTTQGPFCAPCLRAPPDFDRARAAVLYDDASRPLILAFKHGDRTDAAPTYAGWLARAAAPLVDEAELVLPVPLHRWRLLRRRYNQSALLAQALAARLGRPYLPHALVRRRPTRSQGHLSPAARERNVRGAFAVPDPAAVHGRGVLLVDDVLTTGATLSACARALKRAGAGPVLVVTLARVVRAGG